MGDTDIILNYLEWQKAIHGGFSTEELHRQLVAEKRPFPTVDEAIAAVKRVEVHHGYLHGVIEYG